MENVLIRIKAHQETSKQVPSDYLELHTEGKHYYKNGAVYLIYEESELSGIPGCVTSLKIQGESLKLRRYGIASNEMLFEVGRKSFGIYDTPVGTIDMEITTNRVENKLVNNGSSGSVFIDYNISLKGLIECHNILDIRVSELKSGEKTGKN